MQRCNNKCTYGCNLIWPNEKYATKDVMKLVQLPFEDMMVNVPSNYEYYVKRQYGDDCLIRYVIQDNTDNHSLVEYLPEPKQRMKFWESWQRLNQNIGLDKCPTLVGKESSIIMAMYGIEIATPNKSKTKRKLELIARYLKDNVKYITQL